jgi:flagellar hook protein FlgE
MSFQQGISGLNATAKNLDVIGNNIANANTIGAKSSRVEFADMYSGVVGSTKTAGVGVTVAAVAQNFTQGSITATGNPLDMAIAGNGFFQVKTADSSVRYSRDGQFKLDRNGYIVNNQGNRLMGYSADSTGLVQPGQARELQLSASAIEPKATSRIQLQANLDSRGRVTASTPGVIDFNDANTYNSATSVTAVDANGKDVVVTFFFQKTGPQTLGDPDTWDVWATANGVPVPSPFGGADGQLIQLTFPGDGKAPLPDPTDPDFLANFQFDIPAGAVVNGVGTMPINGVRMDFSSFTQFASPFGITRLDQDGYGAGALTGISVEGTGLVRANYSNGRSRTIGQIELATFANLNGLRPLGGNEWARSLDSGEPVLGVPGSGNLGSLQTSALEDSNIDLTSELVNMMVAQRVYQANAQTIKTQDQVLQTLVNMR